MALKVMTSLSVPSIMNSYEDLVETIGSLVTKEMIASLEEMEKIFCMVTVAMITLMADSEMINFTVRLMMTSFLADQGMTYWSVD